MRNSLELNLCIADVNEILTKAITDHVLKQDGYEVKEVFWDGHKMHFRIKLEPKSKQQATTFSIPCGTGQAS